MALAAQPFSHFAPNSSQIEPSWKESIVPVLKQRLQTESHFISKRLSTQPSPVSDTDVNTSGVTSNGRPNPSSKSYQDSSNTANQSSSNNSPAGAAAVGKVPSIKRNRTNSSPYNYQQAPQSQSQTPSSPNSSLNSRHLPPTATRIPKVSRFRSSSNTGTNQSHTSSSSHAHSVLTYGRTNGVNALRKDRSGSSYEPPDDVGYGHGHGQYNSYTSSSYAAYIRDEEPPFSGSATSAEFPYEQTRLLNSQSISRKSAIGGNSGSMLIDRARSIDVDPKSGGNTIPRFSTESTDAERPFEHWYRGEAARNGGVGELKIGRKEMLDIAQFGHERTNSTAGRSRVNSRIGRGGGIGDYDSGRGTPGTIAMDTNRSSPIKQQRRRAGSVDEHQRERESWIIVDEAAAQFAKVMDESPLTDIETDGMITEPESNVPQGQGNGGYWAWRARVGMGAGQSGPTPLQQSEQMQFHSPAQKGDHGIPVDFSTGVPATSMPAQAPASRLPRPHAAGSGVQSPYQHEQEQHSTQTLTSSSIGRQRTTTPPSGIPTPAHSGGRHPATPGSPPVATSAAGAGTPTAPIPIASGKASHVPTSPASSAGGTVTGGPRSPSSSKIGTPTSPTINTTGLPTRKNSKSSKSPGGASSRSKSKQPPSSAAAAAAVAAGEKKERPESIIASETDIIPYRTPPREGNWDDIVLPAVTKKMGIEGYGLRIKGEDGKGMGIVSVGGEEVGGVGKSWIKKGKKRNSIVAPAPGTFGYDYRPPDDIALSDISNLNTDTNTKAEQTIRTPSPLAFPEYTTPPASSQGPPQLQYGSPPAKKQKHDIPAITVSPPSVNDAAKREKDKDEHGGCCSGCVIM